MTQWPSIVMNSNFSSRLNAPNQSIKSNIKTYICIYIKYSQEFFYTEDFRKITQNITVSECYGSSRPLAINIKAAKPQQNQPIRTLFRLKASQPTRT